ncbi:MAG: ribonuclease P protein component [Patescibacteria group bacterium]|nr:ribonuclease P protein component [Patescibacteria group bacterium]
MIKKNLRLNVARFPKKSQTAANTEYFIIKVSKNSLNFNRIGALISAKVSKSSVERNRLRRLALDYLQQNVEVGDEKGGKDVLIVFRPKASSLSRSSLYLILSQYVKLI